MCFCVWLGICWNPAEHFPTEPLWDLLRAPTNHRSVSWVDLLVQVTKFLSLKHFALLHSSLSLRLGLSQQGCLCLSASLISKFSNSWVTHRHNVYAERRRQRHAGCGEGWCQNSCLFIFYNETSCFFQRLQDWAQKSLRSKQTLGREGSSLINLHTAATVLCVVMAEVL